MSGEKRQLPFVSLLTVLIIFALLLTVRLVYLYLADAERFPVNTIKIAATYQHINRKQIASILSDYLTESFFTLPVDRLQTELETLGWTQKVTMERVWPDTLKIILVEKKPIAVWNESLMTAEGELFTVGKEQIETTLPRLNGPMNQQLDVLQIYQKLSKLLAIYGLQTGILQLRNNQAWELFLTNGVLLRLGKVNLEQRLQRFCKAYSTVFAEKLEQLSSVDLRYARGMAVQWKQQTRR